MDQRSVGDRGSGITRIRTLHSKPPHLPSSICSSDRWKRRLALHFASTIIVHSFYFICPFVFLNTQPSRSTWFRPVAWILNPHVCPTFRYTSYPSTMSGTAHTGIISCLTSSLGVADDVKWIVVPSLIPGSYLLAYAIPMLLLSITATLSGAFLTADRTRSFAPIDPPPSIKSRTRRGPVWRLEGGFGGVIGGWLLASKSNTYR